MKRLISDFQENKFWKFYILKYEISRIRNSIIQTNYNFSEQFIFSVPWILEYTQCAKTIAVSQKMNHILCKFHEIQLVFTNLYKYSYTTWLLHDRKCPDIYVRRLFSYSRSLIDVITDTIKTNFYPRTSCKDYSVSVKLNS